MQISQPSCVWCVQGVEKLKSQGVSPQVIETVKLAITSFNHFDKDGNGSLAQVSMLLCLPLYAVHHETYICTCRMSASIASREKQLALRVAV